MIDIRRRLRGVGAALLVIAAATPAMATLERALATERARSVPPRIARDAFIVDPIVLSVTIAPDGRHVAWLRMTGKVRGLWVQPVGGAARRVLRRTEATSVLWSHDGRALFLPSDRTVTIQAIDGGPGSGVIAPLDGARGSGGPMRFAGVDPWQPAAVILSQERRIDGRHDPIGYRMWRIGRGGSWRLLAFGSREIVDYALAPDGHLAFAKVVDGDRHLVIARRADGRYQALASCAALRRCDLIGTNANGRSLFMASDLGGDLRALMRIDADGRRTILNVDPANETDLDALVIDPRSGAPAIAAYRGGIPARYGLNADTRNAVARLDRALDGRDGTIEMSAGPWLIGERDARLQGVRWGLFDPRTGALRPLIDSIPPEKRIAAALLAPTIPVTFRASDGMAIHGLLTVPPGRDPARAPLIAFVHGGPWSRDTPEFSAQSQLLANRGYAVFRPQFRGSTGYGRAYLFAAKGDFGDGRVQRDIEEGVRHLLARGIGDPKRVGIAGASFGGYSVLQGLSNRSNLFRVGVAIVPPPDFGWAMRWVVARGDVGRAQGVPFAVTLRALDLDSRDPVIAQRLREQSPAARIARLDAPLLILAAGRDDRVAIRGVADYAARLKLANKPARVVVARDQPHSTDDPMARRATLYLMEAMLATQFGGSRATRPMPDVQRWMDTNLVFH